MKTPMQELIEQLKEYYDLELKVSGTKNEPILWAIGKAQALLKKEKEVIENAVKQGWDYNEEGLVQWMGETYYNETFNTEEEMRADKEVYHLRTLRYYGDGGIVNEIHGFVKLIAIHGGGNYGLAEQYDIVNSEGRYKLQYYGDSSAKVTKYETFNTKECYHKGKYTYNRETFECHKCGLIVPNEYRFNTKEK